MLNRVSGIKLIAAAAVLTCGGAAQAALTVYTSESDFLTAVAGLGLTTGVDTFDDLTNAVTPGPLARSAGSIDYQASTGGTGGDFFPAGSPSDVWLSTDLASDPVVFSQFESGVQAIGGAFFTSDITGAALPNKRITVIAEDADGTSQVGFAGRFSFVGFISDGPLTSLTVFTPDGFNVRWPTINNLVLATAVPEPGTYALMFSGLAALGFLARRRRAAD